MFCSRSVQVGVAIVSVTAATGAVVYLVLKDYKNKCYEISRKEWAELGDDVVVLHRSLRPIPGLGLSPFDIKVN